MAEEILKLGVVAAALSPDVRSAPISCAKAGFGGLQFEAQAPSLDLTALSDTGRREFRRLLESQAQQLVGLRHDIGGKGIAPGADVDRELSRMRRVMEAAKGLGAPLICVDIGPLPAPAVTENPKPTVTPAMAGLILLPDGNARTLALKPQRVRHLPHPIPKSFRRSTRRWSSWGVSRTVSARCWRFGASCHRSPRWNARCGRPTVRGSASTSTRPPCLATSGSWMKCSPVSARTSATSAGATRFAAPTTAPSPRHRPRRHRLAQASRQPPRRGLSGLDHGRPDRFERSRRRGDAGGGFPPIDTIIEASRCPTASS